MEIVGSENDLWKRAKLVNEFVFNSIKKAPYISLPDAIETLTTRQGDCNEHAALFTALARAAGIPTRMVVGLVHSNTSMTSALTGRPLEKPGFYYHAWVEVFNGNRWISMDPTWNQVPAGAAHIAFVEGASDQQIQLVGLVGNLRLSLVSQVR
jgi:transglutaminase-like putative cysteine protease